MISITTRHVVASVFKPLSKFDFTSKFPKNRYKSIDFARYQWNVVYIGIIRSNKKGFRTIYNLNSNFLLFGNNWPKRSVRYTTLYYEVLRILSGNQGLWALPRWWYIKIYMIWKTIWFSIRGYPLSIRTVSVSCVKAHNVMLGILILQKNLLFKYKNLSINGINTHRKVIYFGMLTKDKWLSNCVQSKF